MHKRLRGERTTNGRSHNTQFTLFNDHNTITNIATIIIPHCSSTAASTHVDRKRKSFNTLSINIAAAAAVVVVIEQSEYDES